MSKKLMMAVLSLALAVPIWATTITFGELPFQSVHGLTYQGVTFGFTVGGVPSADGYYNEVGPGILTYVQEPVLEGTTEGILALNFASPTPVLQFGAALSTVNPVSPGLTVALFDSALNPLGTILLDTSPLVAFSEGLFSYSGTAVSRALIEFDQIEAARFAIDNLTYGANGVIPEPASAGLLGLGLAVFGWLRRRRR